jgi:hypothetical protein
MIPEAAVSLLVAFHVEPLAVLVEKTFSLSVVMLDVQTDNFAVYLATDLGSSFNRQIIIISTNLK